MIKPPVPATLIAVGPPRPIGLPAAAGRCQQAGRRRAPRQPNRLGYGQRDGVLVAEVGQYLLLFGVRQLGLVERDDLGDVALEVPDASLRPDLRVGERRSGKPRERAGGPVPAVVR